MSVNSSEQVILTEEDLLKGIQALEAAPKTVAPTEPVAKPMVVVSAADVLKMATEAALQKSTQPNAALMAGVKALGDHIDVTVKELQKSVAQAAQRDVSMLTVLTEMKKSIEALSTEVKQLGETTTATPRAVTTEAPLAKSSQTEPKVQDVKKQVLVGLENLVKSADPGSRESMSWAAVTTKFESTGQISDTDLAAALNAAKKGGK